MAEKRMFPKKGKGENIARDEDAYHGGDDAGEKEKEKVKTGKTKSKKTGKDGKNTSGQGTPSAKKGGEEPEIKDEATKSDDNEGGRLNKIYKLSGKLLGLNGMQDIQSLYGKRGKNGKYINQADLELINKKRLEVQNKYRKAKVAGRLIGSAAELLAENIGGAYQKGQNLR